MGARGRKAPGASLPAPGERPDDEPLESPQRPSSVYRRNGFHVDLWTGVPPQSGTYTITATVDGEEYEATAVLEDDGFALPASSDHEVVAVTSTSLTAERTPSPAAVTGLTRLRRVGFRATPLEDTSPIEHMTWLEQLELSVTKVTDVGFLRGFTDLETLRRDVSYDGPDLDDPDVMADIRALLDSGVHVRYEPQRR